MEKGGSWEAFFKGRRVYVQARDSDEAQRAALAYFKPSRAEAWQLFVLPDLEKNRKSRQFVNTMEDYVSQSAELVRHYNIQAAILGIRPVNKFATITSGIARCKKLDE